MNLHVLHQGRQLGPFDEGTLRTRIAAGEFGPEDLAWREGMTGWMPLREVHPALFSAAFAPSPAFPPPLAVGPAPAPRMPPALPQAAGGPSRPAGGGGGMPTWVKVMIGLGVATILLVLLAIGGTGYLVYRRAQAAAERTQAAVRESKRAAEAETLHNQGFARYQAKDYAGARPLFERAAALGSAPSQHNLGIMSLHGEGAPKDPAQALAWFEKAAAQGYASSQGQVGLCYSFYEGLPHDYPRAVEWFRKAAEQDEPQAVNNLAAMYEEGLGVPKDLAKAREGYQRALSLGYAMAKQSLARLDRPAAVVTTTPAPAPLPTAPPPADDPPPPPSPPAGSPFAGRWQGPWKDAGTGQSGTFTFTVAADGSFQGQTRNDTGNVSGPMRGTINREGDLRATYSYRTGDGAGAYAMAGRFIRQPNRLMGKVIFFSGKERIGAATVDLTGGGDEVRPTGR